VNLRASSAARTLKYDAVFLFWSYTYHAGTGAFSYDDALAVMRKYPSF
jgi:hypothetical protein